jgi:apolipoprotein N-acyltransferase
VEYVDFASIGGFLALFLGILMVSGGLYARRGGRLRTRQGAAVLAGFSAILGATFLAVGFIALLRA